MDNVGHVYRYQEIGGASPTWTAIGNIGQTNDELYGKARVFAVRADQRKAYIITSGGTLLEMDLLSGQSRGLGNLALLESQALGGMDFYGNHAWDGSGRFYFTAFPKTLPGSGVAKLVAIDPARFMTAVRN